MALWIADEGEGLLREGRTLCREPSALCACGNTVVCAQTQQATVFAADTGRELGRFPLPPGVSRMCALPGALYALSAEADSVSLLCPRTGQLRLCAQAGCYPRDLKLSPCRRLLLAAGGAAGALFVYRAEDLSLLRRISLPGVVYSAAFAGAQLLAMCAVEENSMQSRLYRVSVRGVASEVTRFSALPGALLALPDGGVLCGILGALIRLRPDGRVQQRIPCGLACALRPCAGCVLAADSLGGQVLRLPTGSAVRAQRLYTGTSPVDMLLL